MSRFRTSCLAVAALCGCGRVRFAPHGDAATDAPADACQLGPWSTPVRDDQLSSSMTDEGPALTADGLEVFLHSDRPGTLGKLDILHAVRASVAEPFGTPVPVANINTAEDEGGAALTPDGLTLYFDSHRSGTQGVYRATRPSRTADFGTPVPLLALVNIEGVTISSDGTEMFGNTMGGNENLVRVTGFETATPTTEVLTALDTGDNEGYPTISGDGLTIYYTSGTDLGRATRPAIGAPFVSEGIDPLSGPMSDDDAEISRDGTLFLQASTRGTSTSIDIYTSSRSCVP